MNNLPISEKGAIKFDVALKPLDIIYLCAGLMIAAILAGLVIALIAKNV